MSDPDTIVGLCTRLVTDLRRALGPAVVVTMDPAQVTGSAQRGVVLVQPPTIRYQAADVSDATFEVGVIAGPPGDPLAALDRLDGIVSTLRASGIGIARAEPGTFTPVNGRASLPAYTLNLHPYE